MRRPRGISLCHELTKHRIGHWPIPRARQLGKVAAKAGSADILSAVFGYGPVLEIENFYKTTTPGTQASLAPPCPRRGALGASRAGKNLATEVTANTEGNRNLVIDSLGHCNEQRRVSVNLKTGRPKLSFLCDNESMTK